MGKKIKGNIRIVFLFLLMFFGFVFIYAGNPMNIAVVFSSDIQPYQDAYAGFAGFLMEEKKISLSVSKYNLKDQDGSAILKQINNQKPDMVLAIGTEALKFAKKNIKNTPVVFAMVVNYRMDNAENITGIVMDIPVEIKIRAIKRILGDNKRIGVIYSTRTDSQYAEAETLSGNMGMKITGIKVDSMENFESALNELKGKIDCFLMLPDSSIYFSKSVERLLLTCVENKIPVIGLSSSYTKAGALFSFDCDFRDMGRQSAELALRIGYKGKINAIPAAFPEKTELSLNLITAEQMKIAISDDIINEAVIVVK